MENNYSSQTQILENSKMNSGHVALIALVVVLLLGATWLEKPQLFSFQKNSSSGVAAVPHYYAYVAPTEDQPQPAVLGASTDQGPQIIGDDGTIQSVDLGEVLGASTQGVQLSTDDVKVNSVPDSDSAITNYFTQAEFVELSPVDNASFEAALSSGDQNQLNQQAQKIVATRDALQKLAVPQSLVKLQQLKIVQYNSAIGLLQNFTQADNNPTLVDQYLEQFIKSQQDLDTENVSVAQKFGSLDPQAPLYSAGNTALDFLNDSNSTNASQ